MITLTRVWWEVSCFTYRLARLKAEGWSTEVWSRGMPGSRSHSSTLQRTWGLTPLSSPYTTTNITDEFVTTFLTFRQFKYTVFKVRLPVGNPNPSLCTLLVNQRRRGPFAFPKNTPRISLTRFVGSTHKSSPLWSLLSSLTLGSPLYCILFRIHLYCTDKWTKPINNAYQQTSI